MLEETMKFINKQLEDPKLSEEEKAFYKQSGYKLILILLDEV